MGVTAPMALLQGINQPWSPDFVSDALACGQRFRILAVVDDFTRECRALVVDTSLSGARLARELDASIAARCKPLVIISDNGTELSSMDGGRSVSNTSEAFAQTHFNAKAASP